MNITETEMHGLLTGKCIPGDMLVNEELPAYLVRKFSELKSQSDALATENVVLKVSRQGAVNAFDDAMNEFGMAPGETAADYPAPETPTTDAYLNSVRAEALPEDVAEIIDSGDLESILFASEAPLSEQYRMALYKFRLIRAGEPS